MKMIAMTAALALLMMTPAHADKDDDTAEWVSSLNMYHLNCRPVPGILQYGMVALAHVPREKSVAAQSRVNDFIAREGMARFCEATNAKMPQWSFQGR